ncbi:MAG: hypothetical protein CM15mP109_15420 [Candidatus Dadabacteria bacterium]|nr:MAG: hypothetical protein CM15mP109_15420 [Candidatus Dadabacteria bacterium]
MLKNILFTGLVIFYATILSAESHQKNSVDSDFKTAVKHIEKRGFLKPMKFFQI